MMMTRSSRTEQKAGLVSYRGGHRKRNTAVACVMTTAMRSTTSIFPMSGEERYLHRFFAVSHSGCLYIIIVCKWVLRVLC